MAPLVVLLRGVNVGGHRTFRPSQLAQALEKYQVTNIGAADTFVVHAKVTQSAIRAAFEKAMPFETSIMICPGHEIVELVASNPFRNEPQSRDLVPFVTVLEKSAKVEAPVQLPATGEWELKIIEQQGRYVLGIYRRSMKAIQLLGKLDKQSNVVGTTRNWNTMNTIARIVQRT